MTSTLHARYGLKRVINASGRMSILGVSAPSDTVMEAMRIGGQSYVEIADLVNKAGDRIAAQIGFESAVVVNSASSGIALAVAGIVTGGDPGVSVRLHQRSIEKNEIVMLKGHNVQYGAPVETMIYLGGGSVVEAGYANEGTVQQMQDCVTERTAALLYVKSHHAVQKNMASLDEVWTLAQQLHLPLIVDAAAEEDLQRYASCSDLVIFSGSKAIEGPTSGIVAGKRRYIQQVKVQLHGIGRSMKVGKESTFGLLQALDEYLDKKDNSVQERNSLNLLLPLGELHGVQVSIVQDEAGRQIYRARIKIDPELAGINALQTVERLQNGEIAIYTRDYGARQGYFDIDPRPLLSDDMQVIQRRLQEILQGGV
ncbi:DgaE family pyridoxal phosphate-dependent ammonia lyase [Saccharibacillus sp. JS10]|uniref:DgaE family pyridoxal phosphate-dependent ammonia lyase n=1 Tax=Saccharibacillus sp. JS10 TaxID=2950552 RepID=UPI00210A7FF6|nr:DgaE family pyridoxal phosphate-dependent ammonia lyase [Saccharibacillus sp. JS10]MCQ4088902.1 DgaE family pyridoxal phosphate-dependent ammonia lyase [Saccharibacillus sp. JS10]